MMPTRVLMNSGSESLSLPREFNRQARWTPSQNGPRERRGVALLLVLFLVVLLASVTIAASGAARSSGDLVTAKRASATARAMAESGITVAVTTIGDSLRRLSRDSIATNVYLNALDVATNNGTTALDQLATDTLADGAFAIAVVDVDARLDVNEAGPAGLTKFFTEFVGPVDARRLAERITQRVRSADGVSDAGAEARINRDSLAQVLLGRTTPTQGFRHPLQSLDELREIPGVDNELLARVVPMLTVDGDSRINRRSASANVLAAATGSITDAPTRLLIVARGWQLGHPLTHEIQAVYDVSPNGLTLVRWRERVL